eukprot:Rmarinus@m.14045
MPSQPVGAGQQGTTTSVVAGGVKKFHTTYPDGSEMVEEYDVKTDDLLVRKTRRKQALGGEGEWEYEVGIPPKQQAAAVLEQGGMVESSKNPIFTRKDMEQYFQWRIRNLPYPKDVYSVTVDERAREIVVRTSNKKYYKRFNIPDLDRLALPVEEKAVSWKHENCTLIIRYQKPDAALSAEVKAKAERSKMKARKDGDV